MIKYNTGICTMCSNNAPIVKKLINERLCFYCNKKRLSEKKERKKTGELEFMKSFYSKSKKVCEECGTHITEFNPVNISHILSKGAYPKFRLEPKNVNLLCLDHHRQWEFGDRKIMSIYKKNIKIIMELINKYYNT